MARLTADTTLEGMETMFETVDARLAAYLSLLREYTAPLVTKRGDGVTYAFATIQQDDILGFYANMPAYVPPQILLKRYDDLLHQTRCVKLGMAPSPD